MTLPLFPDIVVSYSVRNSGQAIEKFEEAKSLLEDNF